MKLNKEKDNIISIVKSLHPINYLYSKQNRDYEKHFRNSSLKGLIKQINTRKTYNEFLIPGESIEDLDNKKNTFMDVNFKSTFNYIDELNKVKSLPLSQMNKFSKNLYKIKDKSKKNEDKILLKIRQKESRNIPKKKSWDENVTLDPGKYCPKYDYIRKKIPCAFIGRPKNTEDKEEIENNNNNKIEEKNNKEKKSEENSKIINKENNKDNSKDNNKDNNNDNNKDNKEIKNANQKNDKTILKLNNMKTCDEKNKLNKTNFLYKNSNKKIQILSKQKEKNSSRSIIKNQNTVSSWSNTLDFESSKKLTEQHKSKDIKNISIENNSKFNCYSTQRIDLKKYSKKNLFKNSSSMDSLRCPIIFDKMQGREKFQNLDKDSKQPYRIIYNPNYNALRPHIPAVKFNSGKKNQDYKKYIVGKILRSYCNDPKEYFVFEYKENQEIK
jgi:hypothetical protein